MEGVFNTRLRLTVENNKGKTAKSMLESKNPALLERLTPRTTNNNIFNLFELLTRQHRGDQLESLTNHQTQRKKEKKPTTRI